MSGTADSTRKFELTREYSTPYNALIRDDVVMGIPRYFLERWVPKLGTNAATVVNTLRQLNYRCSTDNSVTISGTSLAREAAMSRRHLYTCLETPWMSAFIRSKSGEWVRSETGKITQETNSYFVRMDDPLTPADADHLCCVLTNLADTPLHAAQRALELKPRELWAPDPKQTPDRFTHPRSITAKDVLHRAFPTWIPPTEDARQLFAQYAEALHRHVTLVREDGKTSKIIVPQYFRKRWWKLLGHDLAWTYLWLRGCVYDNPAEGIRRDICWIPSLNALLAVIDRPREWWRRNVENRKPTENWSLDDFFKQLESQKGRDPANPQWVARQFRIVLDMPIAPEDRDMYTQLLNSWKELPNINQETQKVQGPRSATFKHTGRTEVCHIQTHREDRGLPHSNTPGGPGSATFKHRDSESNQIELKTKQYQNNTKHLDTAQTTMYGSTSVGAGEIETERDNQVKVDSLIDQIAEKYDFAPQTPLYACAPIDLWMQQAWLEPVRPYTPAWSALKTGQISARDMLALMLAIWADKAIQHPPRYLSWLIQRWQIQSDMPPVDYWDRWQSLADLPVGDWPEQGCKEWLELALREDRVLPFGLDALWPATSPAYDSLLQLAARQAEIDEISMSRAQSVVVSRPGHESNGLDERPGNGVKTISDIWQAALDHLSGQINLSTYQDWVEGTEAVSYTNGVLTVQVKHVMAREWLSKQRTIEETASALAKMPITIRYIS